MNEAQREPGRMRRWVKAARTTLNMPVKYATYATAGSAGPIYPDRIYVESTNHCNLKCIMCPTGLGVMLVHRWLPSAHHHASARTPQSLKPP